MKHVLEFDPVEPLHRIVTIGATGAMQRVLQRYGDLSPLLVGASIAADAWRHIDLLVVELNEAPGSPTAGLTSARRSSALMMLRSTLLQAGRHRVPRVVIEHRTATRPHTGTLRDACDVYATDRSIEERAPRTALGSSVAAVEAALDQALRSRST